MNAEIVELTPAGFSRCGEIWDLAAQPDLAERFSRELDAGLRRIWVCVRDGHYIAEIALVFDTREADYTVPGRRAYVSHLVVRPECRRQGVGRRLLRHVCKVARTLGYAELSVGVDLENFPALALYASEGFDRILRAERDDSGAYLKLLKRLQMQSDEALSGKVT